MINEGDFLESPAMRSLGAATGTRTSMPACSISTTTGPTTRTTSSASADPKVSRLEQQHAAVKSTIFGRKSPGDSLKARHYAKPETVAGLTSAATGCGRLSAFTRLTSLDNLFQCWRNAKKNKSTNPRIQRFGDDPLRYLVMIQDRLRSHTYAFGPYKTFTVQEKKFRHVVDAPMKDRIVHWMLYSYLLPIWQPRFIHDTFGNLPGRGTLAAVNRLSQFCRAEGATWVLQMDISKYFYSINHALLKQRALRFIGDISLRNLITDLVDSFQTDHQFDDLFAVDSMYRRTAAKGMPIGNLSSQLFANVFLSDFDHWIKEDLRIKHYIRYVDDIVILGRNRGELLAISDLVVAKLAKDGLTIHPYKTRLAPTTAGIPFLGYVVWPNHISAGTYVRRRYHYRLRQHEKEGYNRIESLRSYAAMFSHTGLTNQKKEVQT